uniref:PA domain-containing protein n=1 Tax=Plectus sambesii TaxID=2011161 RepID=A0A914XP99_9BILA
MFELRIFRLLFAWLLLAGPSLLIEAAESSIYFFHVVRPDYLSYSYEIQLARNIGLDFSRELKSVQLVYASPDNACSPLDNAEEIKGAVVLVERGHCSFLTKAIESEKAGALAVLVTDSKGGGDEFIEMVADETTRKAYIPAAFMPGQNGKMFRQHLLYKSAPIFINIPLNLTFTLLENVRKPPWELW